MTLREMDGLFKDPSKPVQNRTAQDINLAMLDLLLDATFTTVAILGINEVADVKGTTDRKYAVFENTNGVGFTFNKIDYENWDGNFILTLIDRPDNVTAIDKFRVKRKFSASEISKMLTPVQELSTYTIEHK